MIQYKDTPVPTPSYPEEQVHVVAPADESELVGHTYNILDETKYPKTTEVKTNEIQMGVKRDIPAGAITQFPEE